MVPLGFRLKIKPFPGRNFLNVSHRVEPWQVMEEKFHCLQKYVKLIFSLVQNCYTILDRNKFIENVKVSVTNL
jgi:hypothetical protein